MRHRGVLGLGLWVAAGAVTWVLVLLDPAAGLPEWVFGTFLLGLAAQVVLGLVRAVRRARAERRRAVQLARSEPGAVALAAIEEERRRLGQEIAAVLRSAMGAIIDDVATLDAADPRPGLRRIHERAQLATSELRRQLGLLRDPAPEPSPPSSPRSVAVPRRDLVLGAGLALLASVETTAYLLTEGPRALLPWSVAFTAVAAGCVAGRTTRPAASALACAAVFAAGTLAGYPLLGGFWSVGTLGCLTWAVVTRRPLRALDLLAGAAMVVVVGWTRVLDDPDNAGVVGLLLVVAVAAAFVSRMVSGREWAARVQAETRVEELEEATRAAVAAERAGFARDLHDVASHAVGLIAMQAAAAQVSWPRDPDQVQRSVRLVEETARATKEELERLGLVATPTRGRQDVHAVVDRIRSAGTSVDLTIEGAIPVAVGDVVHRVVQESLTNAVRHAPGAAVRVRVVSDGSRVSVRVCDDGRGPVATGRGYGLVGLSERVALVGGTFRAGVGPDGGFVVEATLPVDREAVAP